MFEPNLQNVDEVELRDRAARLLQKYKEAEKKISFHKEKLNKNTIVYCKSKENIEIYREQLTSSKIVFKN